MLMADALPACPRRSGRWMACWPAFKGSFEVERASEPRHLVSRLPSHLQRIFVAAKGSDKMHGWILHRTMKYIFILEAQLECIIAVGCDHNQCLTTSVLISCI